MKRIVISLISIALFLSGCATTHSGSKANVITDSTNRVEKEQAIEPEISKNDGNKEIKEEKTSAKGSKFQRLTISCDENKALSSGYFGTVSFTFENNTNEWLAIKELKVNFGEEILNDNVQIPVGEDLQAWAEGIKNRNQIRRHNKLLTSNVLGIIGAGLSMSSDSNMNLLGKTMVAGAGTTIVVSEIENALNKVQNAALVPRTHLLSGDFRIPPGLFIRKWILFYTNKPLEIPTISAINIEYKDLNETVNKLRCKFRDNKEIGASSPWQHKLRYLKPAHQQR